jgi:vacuolar iron transporter family protein
MSKKSGLVASVKQHFEDYLSEFVYGGIDGVITTFAVVAGATGARLDLQTSLQTGFQWALGRICQQSQSMS